jgi:CHAD domain-containing protein
MAYRLQIEDDQLAASLRDAIREQIRHAADCLRTGKDRDPVEAVHEARKSIKKARSALRLARRPVGGRTYRAEMRALRDVGRELSGSREADVMVQTLDKLTDRAVGRIPKTGLKTLRAQLAEQAQRSRAGATRNRAVLARRLEEIDERAQAWPLDGCDWPAVRKAMRRSYRAGRRGLGAIEQDPTTEGLHEWRKRVKDLWYHQRLVRDLWPELMKREASEAHELTEILGDDHDLAVLRAMLVEDRDAAATTPADLEPLVEAIDARRAELLAEARRLGRRLYAERPKAYAARLDGYRDSLAAGSEVPVAA